MSPTMKSSTFRAGHEDSPGRMSDIDNETNEVELSTEELADLCPHTPVAGASSHGPGNRPIIETRKDEPQSSSQTKSRPLSGDLTSARYYVVAIAAVAAAAATVFLLPQHNEKSAAVHTAQWRPLPDEAPEAEDFPEPPNTASLKPVRIRNEFDRSEVFEFPAGTSMQEARDQVAQLLLQRARERQLQPQSSS
jgi:hypothetical protein